MDTFAGLPGPYTLSNLFTEARTQLPHLMQRRNRFLPGFSGRDKIPAPMRIAVHLRASRLLGCPICAGIFPHLAKREGLSRDDIDAITHGMTHDLDDDIHGAVTWASTILAAEGETPPEIPEPALALSEAQREHLHYMMRLERLVHATGLMFLPHGWVSRTAGV